VQSREFAVQPIADEDRPWIKQALRTRWGGPDIVTRGRIHRAHELPGFMALEEGERLGCVTYRFEGAHCEVVSLDSFHEGRGIGGALLAAVEREARRRGAERTWLITTNDNMKALRFYQRRGYRLVDVHAGAVEVDVHAGAIEYSRQLKPSIPAIGIDEIPIRDELELEKSLGNQGD
jgi:GNAT superfamily N-acetyltransferase